ncbi:MAG: hypothetical protein COU11_01540 [Candidatus Harrisonbacteria bacterium CG10_big_fil_rev_8_21_14_0_10_49_15]|uniref:Metallo-beta-lactamase domain-containing protein n=1 Tax=Candidatus Harrisonbacteria bacterium CG10_big_fil_rev_8_21_14_0_10_49_15 TaxID=1974587 RepID=A0A2H0ULE9_9BACT|nr:MAG: hypothetical protein COU11_01540 [Candidatus Harrisonbacteria bacterium CG10_big_fil_rev_8_21_14_0_10_49_15]
MKVQKFHHSCLLIEDGDTSVLIDPGVFSFGPNRISAESLPKIDAILITHKHADHCHPPTIKQLIERDNATVYCNADIASELVTQGINTQTIVVPEDIKLKEIAIASVAGEHEPLPVPIPQNNGFYINHRLLHPGDSHSFEQNLKNPPEILALPIAAPWGTVTRAIEIALALKPKHVIPIHDAIISNIFLPRLHEMCASVLNKAGIQFHPLQPGEILEL